MSTAACAFGAILVDLQGQARHLCAGVSQALQSSCKKEDIVFIMSQCEGNLPPPHLAVLPLFKNNLEFDVLAHLAQLLHLFAIAFAARSLAILLLQLLVFALREEKPWIKQQSAASEAEPAPSSAVLSPIHGCLQSTVELFAPTLQSAQCACSQSPSPYSAHCSHPSCQQSRDCSAIVWRRC